MTDDRATTFELPAETRVGRVALRVGSLDDVLPFYRDTLGLAADRDGTTARLAAGDETLLVLEEAPGASDRHPAEAGLFHFAIRVPDRAALGDALERIRNSDAELSGASDHLASEALYLDDPEGNGVEVYRDRPREDWPWTDDGGVALETHPLDLDALSVGRGVGSGLRAGTDVGHVHLEVTDLTRAEAFYRDALGLRLRTRDGDRATFLAAGDYHHHVGLNVWNRRTEPATGGLGLAWFELLLPDPGTADRLASHLGDRPEDSPPVEGARPGTKVPRGVPDPDGIGVRLSVAGKTREET